MPISNITDFDLLADFLLDIDSLKSVQRRSYIVGGTRLENTAEHSWHIAIAAWTLARHASTPVSIERVLKLAIVHDLCELDDGDTFAHSADPKVQAKHEQACVARLERTYGDLLGDFRQLWEEHERGQTTESKLVRLADRLLPFLQNIANEGKTWQEHKIRKSQVLSLNQEVKREFPELFAWIESKLEHAVAAGWLGDS